jgi:hypothetical protein
MTIQVVMAVIIAGAAAFAYFEGHFVTNMVAEQLTAQKIYFPPPSEIKPGGALDPAEFPPEIQNQAGNQVTNGDQAKIYADDFIAKHLESVAGGQTYSQVSSEAIAVQSKLSAMQPTDPGYAAAQAQLAKLNAQKTTLFQGEMLRATLLNSYGWWTVGVDVTYASYGLALAALVVLGALVFEIVVAVRRPSAVRVIEKSGA